MDSTRPTRPRMRDLALLVLAFLVLMFAYEAARDLVAPAAGARVPYEHADRVIDIERGLGLFVEPDVQRVVHEIPGGRFATTWFYTIAYTAGYCAFLLWVLLARRRHLAFVFTWFWVTNFVAVVGYWLFPLAPPRFMEGIGMEDTTKEALELGGSLSWFQPFRNLYAAMPSMHVGQTILYAVAVMLLVGSRRRWLVWLWPAAMLVTVMATANHYWLDGVGGALCVGVAFAVTRAVLGPVRRTAPLPAPAPAPG